MKCLILAAGYATRLYPLTEHFPKPLLPVGGKPILDWLIDDLDLSGEIGEYIVISNHKFVRHFREWAEKKPQPITVLDDGTESNETRLGAVMDLQLALRERAVSEDCLIIAGDNLLDFSLTGFLRYAKEKQSSCIMRYFEPSQEKLKKCGVLEIGEDDRVLSMEEKPQQPKSNWCCPPFYFYRREEIAQLSRAIEDGCGVDAPGSFPAWLCRRCVVYAMEMPGKRYDIGNTESYQTVQKEYHGIC